MIKFFFLIFSCLLSFSCLSQEIMPSLENVKYLNQDESVVVQIGEPVIFTGHKKKILEAEPQQLNWRPELKKVEIKSFGGSTVEVPFVTHIPSFSIFVQVLSDKSVIVTERIVLINKTLVNDFVRTYPVAFKDVAGEDRFLNRTFLYSKYNNKPITVFPTTDGKTDHLSFFAGTELSSGVHFFETSYLLKDAIQITGNISRLFLPLVGIDNPYLTEHLHVFISYPDKSVLNQAKAFYGVNNQFSDKAGDFYKDENGHLIYNVKGLLAANVDLRIEILGNADGFLPESNIEKIDFGLSHYSWLIMTFLGVLIIYLYLFFSVADLRDKFTNEKFLTKIRSKIKFDSALLRPLIKGKMDARAFLVCLLQLKDKGALDISFANQEKIILTKTKKSVHLSDLDRQLMRFIFPIFTKKRVVNIALWKKKKVRRFKQILKKQIRKLALILMRREVYISGLLFIISLTLILYFGVSLIQFVMAIVILLFFWLYSICLFYNKAQLQQELTVLFKAYTMHPKKNVRQLLSDVALELGDRSSERTLGIDFYSKKIPLAVFEKMFLYQLTTSRGEKNEKI